MRGLRGRMLAASVGVALLGALAFGALLLAIVTLRDNADRARHSEQVLAAANALEKSVLDAETGERGYVISGQSGFLEPWRAALVAIPRESAFLEQLVVDNPAQERRARDISTAIAAYLRTWSRPLVRAAQRDRGRAVALVSSGGGKERVDAIRARFARLSSEEARLADERTASASAGGRRAIFLGVAGMVGSLLLAVALALYFSRLVLVPVRRIMEGSERLAAGELGRRLSGPAKAELGRLQRAFNAMAESLERQRTSLENQHDELEAQHAELEAGQDELERALAASDRDRRRLRALYDVTERLARETEVRPLAEAMLRTVADLLDSPVGLLALVPGNDGGEARVLVTRGVDPAAAPDVARGAGLAGRALAERRPVRAAHPEGSLRLPGFGGELQLREELWVPLLSAGGPLALLALGRTDERPFSEGDLELASHLAEQGAIALAHALAFERERRQAAIHRAVLDSTREPIYMLDREGRLIVENQAYRDMRAVLGISPAGTAADGTRAVAETLVDADSYLTNTRALADDAELELTDELTHEASSRCFVRYSAPVRADDGTVVGRIVVLREVTGEREAQRLKDEFVATVSHELRTPLTSIVGFLELLLGEEPGPLTDDQRRFLRTIERHSSRLSRLVGDLLLAAQIESGRLFLAPEDIDLADVAGECAGLARAAAERKGVELLVRGDGPAPVHGDRGRLVQVVDNLVTNAVKFTPAGGRVEIAATTGGGCAVVEVSDSGIGIPPSERARIFERFFRASTATGAQIAGTGLGLSIARSIAEAHDGTLELVERPGPGTTFRLALPLRVREEVLR